MLSGEACRLLHVTRMTLARYAKTMKDGKPMIKRHQISKGKYIYDDDDVYSLIGAPKVKNEWRVIYARATEKEGVEALDAQIKRVMSWCISNGICVSKIYRDQCDGFDFSRSNRRSFQEMMRDVMERNVKSIIVEAPDRISPVGHEILTNMMIYMGVRVVYLLNVPIDPNHKESTMLETMKHLKNIKKYYENSVPMRPLTAVELMAKYGDTNSQLLANELNPVDQGHVKVEAGGPDVIPEPIPGGHVGEAVPEAGGVTPPAAQPDAVLDADRADGIEKQASPATGSGMLPQ